jgi:hypothetical protein
VFFACLVTTQPAVAVENASHGRIPVPSKQRMRRCAVIRRAGVVPCGPRTNASVTTAEPWHIRSARESSAVTGVSVEKIAAARRYASMRRTRCQSGPTVKERGRGSLAYGGEAVDLSEWPTRLDGARHEPAGPRLVLRKAAVGSSSGRSRSARPAQRPDDLAATPCCAAVDASGKPDFAHGRPAARKAPPPKVLAILASAGLLVDAVSSWWNEELPLYSSCCTRPTPNASSSFLSCNGHVDGQRHRRRGMGRAETMWPFIDDPAPTSPRVKSRPDRGITMLAASTAPARAHPRPHQARRMVTCAGSFDRGRHSYRDNLVVDASWASPGLSRHDDPVVGVHHPELLARPDQALVQLAVVAKRPGVQQQVLH